MKRILIPGLTATALLALSACSTPVDNQTPMASFDAPATTDSKLVAPRVSNPLDVSKFEQDPCAVLSQAQANQIANLITTRKFDGNVAPICAWSDRVLNRVSFGFIPHNGGLSTIYANSQGNEANYFELVPDIIGYPAAFFGASDDRDNGGCQIAVGLNDDEVITVSVKFDPSSPHHTDPCLLAVKAAEAALTTLKGAA